MVGGRRRIPCQIFAESKFEKRRLRQISVLNVSTVRDSEKVQLRRTESRPRALQRAIGAVRTLPLSSLKCGSKTIFSFF